MSTNKGSKAALEAAAAELAADTGEPVEDCRLVIKIQLRTMAVAMGLMSAADAARDLRKFGRQLLARESAASKPAGVVAQARAIARETT